MLEDQGAHLLDLLKAEANLIPIHEWPHALDRLDPEAAATLALQESPDLIELNDLLEVL